MHKLLTLFIAMLLFLPLTAQEDDGVMFRKEVGVGLGTAFSLNDANSKFYGNTNIGVNALMRFILNPRMAIKATLGYAGLKGNMANADGFIPNNPGIIGPERNKQTIDGGICDLSVLYELNFLPYGYIRDYRGMKRVTPYIQFGLGMTYATPDNAFTANIPIGVGLKWKVAKRLNLGLDWRMHFSLSDKLDGINAPLGISSKMFKNKDHYSFTLLTLTYDISPKCPNCNKDE